MARLSLASVTVVTLALAWGWVLPGPAAGQPLPAGAGTAGAADARATFGTASQVAQVIHAWDFGVSAGAADAQAMDHSRLCTGGVPCQLNAGVRLPAGALVSRVEMEACDSDPTDEVKVSMWRQVSPVASQVNLTGFVGTGVPAMPGCGRFNAPLVTPETIDNVANTYMLLVNLGPSIATTLMAVRVYYTLQVSDAPATATFGDVPTSHPFFRFVEALVASGITAGCGGGNYCPDAPLTRGQMAVFLGKALGLHFAP